MRQTPSLKWNILKSLLGIIMCLRDINLVINKGENLVILGKSGTGKSVLIKCIVGLVDIDEGTLCDIRTRRFRTQGGGTH